MSPNRPATGDRIVGRRIAAARDQRGWTQADLAEAVGYSVAWVRKVEQADRGLNTHQLRHLAQALDVSAGYLIGESDLLAPPRRRAADLDDVPEADREAARQLLRFQRRVGERWGTAAADESEVAPRTPATLRYADYDDDDRASQPEADADHRRGARRAVQPQPGATRRRFRRLR